jgi:hypothetical protein
MLYKRQKLLLDLVHAAGGELAATDLQKLLFLSLPSVTNATASTGILTA